jgi:recombinational DNA repair protein RecT
MNGNGNGQARGQAGRPDIQAREKTGEERVGEILEQHKEEITALFATDPNPAAAYMRARALAVSAYRKIQRDADDSAAAQNKQPQRINEESAVAVCLFAMQRKLDPGTDVYLVPYGGKVTPILSPQGVIKLIMRSGYAKAVNAHPVFDGEMFDYMLGSEQWIKHKKNNARPVAMKDGRGQVAANPAAWEALTHAYCVIDLKDGGQVLEVHDKGDIAYYRSLSPTATSNYSGWAKFPAEFARKAVLKQAAKFVPQESEVSILLASDDSERGIEIPDEFMRAVGARVVNEMLDGNGSGAPAERKSDPGASANGNGNGNGNGAANGQANGNAPRAGDPKKVFLPGKKGEVPTVADAEDGALSSMEERMRKSFDSGEWDKPERAQYKDLNMTQLATIRAEMKRRGLFHPDHAVFGKGHMLKKLTPEASARGERRSAMLHRVREVLPDSDPRNPDEMSDEELAEVIRSVGEFPPGEEPDMAGVGGANGHASAV